MITLWQQWCPVWIFCLFLLLCPELYLSLSVQFPSKEPVYVIPSQTLALEAKLDLANGEQVAMVTWEREYDYPPDPQKVTVAEFPEKAFNTRITTHRQGAALRVRNFRYEDGGIYTITVTSTTGARSSAACIVQEYEAVYHVSVEMNVSHSLLSCDESWATDPQFSWLHEKVEVTEEVGHVSADGKLLHLSAPPCGHFTCVVSNKLGQDSETYTAEPCEQQGGGATAGVALLVILLICGGVLAFLLWRRRRKQQDTAEGLCEPLEDQL